MTTVIAFYQAHATVILLAAGWLFSAAMSTMPPLPEKAGFLETWVYKFLQAVAANFSKHDDRKVKNDAIQ